MRIGGWLRSFPRLKQTAQTVEQRSWLAGATRWSTGSKPSFGFFLFFRLLPMAKFCNACTCCERDSTAADSSAICLLSFRLRAVAAAPPAPPPPLRGSGERKPMCQQRVLKAGSSRATARSHPEESEKHVATKICQKVSEHEALPPSGMEEVLSCFGKSLLSSEASWITIATA